MTRPIGEVFTFFDSKLVVREDGKDGYSTGCGRCALRCKPCDLYMSVTGSCDDFMRNDHKNVHFEKFGVDW